MNTITDAELKERIAAHGEWLRDDANGRRLELVNYNLSGSNLRESNLRGSDLRGSNLSWSDLRESDLRGSDLRGSNLSESDLSGSNLSWSNPRESDLRGSDLRGSNLSGSNLSGSNLSESKTDYTTIGIELACPEIGAFEAWKNCEGIIVKLFIPADAKRSSATTRKCRASKAVVLDVKGADKATSGRGVTYEKGDTVIADSWDSDRWNECSHGIHFFMNRVDAESWDG